MPTAAPRLMLRHARPLVRRLGLRHASATAKATEATSNAAAKSKDAASDITSKASQGLSRVTSSAGPAISGAAQGVSRALGRIGGRTGRLISFVESMIPPTIYYSKVGLELSKIVFKGQRMSPPNWEAFQAYSQPLFRIIRNPGTLLKQAGPSDSLTPRDALNQIRNMDSQQLASAGVVAAECVGFFAVGEMIGRFKIVGYHGPTSHH